MRASSDSTLSDQGTSCSTRAAAQVSGRRPRGPAPFDEPASRGSRSPSPPTAPPNRRRFVGAHTATKGRRSRLSPQEVASQEEEPTHSRRLPLDQPEPRSRRTFAATVGFHGQRSLLRRSAWLQSVRWLDVPSADIRGRFQNRRTSPRRSGRHRQRVRRRSPSRRERRQDCGHVRNRELRRLAPRLASQSSRRRVSSPSILSRVPTVIRVEERSVPKATLYSAVFPCLVGIAFVELALARKMRALAARKEPTMRSPSARREAAPSTRAAC
ncbi:serine/arginine repetitive matrix protein 1-like [Dermacentor albipictus]|uniref:serine/arginine repetitive matrix protein 1-like n=1 Tax=Dermacentor albipictus TaxID=60249 RepID=UPI0031FDFBB5